MFTAMLCEGVRFPAPFKTARTDAISDEGVVFLVAFPKEGVHF